jgi:hypothetical protein
MIIEFYNNKIIVITLAAKQLYYLSIYSIDSISPNIAPSAIVNNVSPKIEVTLTYVIVMILVHLAT